MFDANALTAYKILGAVSARKPDEVVLGSIRAEEIALLMVAFLKERDFEVFDV